MALPILPSSGSPFDSIRHIDEFGSEFWFGRELMPLLGYKQWRRFEDAIDRASISCENSGELKASHFNHLPGSAKSLGRSGDDYRLSRYACYLTAQNGDPRKPEIAAAQSYFAIKTREAEMSDSQPALTSAEQLLGMAKQLVGVCEQVVIHERKLAAAENEIRLLQSENDRLKSQMHTLESNQDETRLTAQRADNEVMRFRHGRMENAGDGDWFSVKGWASLHKVRLGNSKKETQKNASALGRSATKWCKERGITKEPAYDPDYGTVGVYPQGALIHAFAVVLSVITTEVAS